MSRLLQSLAPAAAALCGLVAAPLALGAWETPLRKAIDAEVRAAWQRAKITPAKPSDDSHFLRRVSLDLIGVIPTYEATVAFLDSKDPAKREKLIDGLLADPRFAQHQAD